MSIFSLFQQLDYLFTGRLFGIALEINVQRGVDLQAFTPDVIGIFGGVVLAFDLIQNIERKVGRGQNIKAFGHRFAQGG